MGGGSAKMHSGVGHCQVGLSMSSCAFHLLPPPLVASKSNGLTVTLVVSLVTSHEGVSKLGANTQASPRGRFWGGGRRGEARRWAQLPHTLVDLPPPAVLCVDM